MHAVGEIGDNDSEEKSEEELHNIHKVGHV
jgi:hypothetical protein